MSVSQIEVQEIARNEHVEAALELCFSSLLSYPDGKHQIENGGVEFTPALYKDQLIKYCQENIATFKQYNLRYARDYRSGKVRESGKIPGLEDI